MVHANCTALSLRHSAWFALQEMRATRARYAAMCASDHKSVRARGQSIAKGNVGVVAVPSKKAV